MAKVSNYMNEAYQNLTDDVFSKYAEELMIQFNEVKNSPARGRNTQGNVAKMVDPKDFSLNFASYQSTATLHKPTESELDNLESLLEIMENKTEMREGSRKNRDDAKVNYDFTVAFLEKYQYKYCKYNTCTSEDM